MGWGRPWRPLRTRPWCRPGWGLSTPCSVVLVCDGPGRCPDGGWQVSGSAPWASSECRSHSGGHSWCRQARWERQDNDETPDEDNEIHEVSKVKNGNKNKSISRKICLKNRLKIRTSPFLQLLFFLSLYYRSFKKKKEKEEENCGLLLPGRFWPLTSGCHLCFTFS